MKGSPKRLDKDAIRVIREEMVRSEIYNCASGWFEYKGKLRELVLVLRSEELDASLEKGGKKK